MVKQYTKSLNYLYTTEDRIKLYLVKPVKDFIKGYKRNRN